jgi:hypothetical protein
MTAQDTTIICILILEHKVVSFAFSSAMKRQMIGNLKSGTLIFTCLILLIEINGFLRRLQSTLFSLPESKPPAVPAH